MILQPDICNSVDEISIQGVMIQKSFNARYMVFFRKCRSNFVAVGMLIKFHCVESTEDKHRAGQMFTHNEANASKFVALGIR